MQFATIKGLRTEKYTLQSQNWRESAKTNKTTRLITARRNKRGTEIRKDSRGKEEIRWVRFLPDVVAVKSLGLTSDDS
jgi:hypothetical protein